MPDPARAALIAGLLCTYERDLSRAAESALREALTPAHGHTVLRLALGRPIDGGAPGPTWDAATLERAASMYIRHRFFHGDATHYEVLGLETGATLQAINENYRLLMRLVHPDRTTDEGRWPVDCTARVNRARAVLKDPRGRADYDERLPHRGPDADRAAPTAPVGAISRPAARQPPPMSLASPLPEWVTLGVGGFAREHPALAMFGLTITAAALLIAAVAWSEPSFFLERVESPGPATDAGVLPSGPEVQTAGGLARVMTEHEADDAQLRPETQGGETTAVRR